MTTTKSEYFFVKAMLSEGEANFDDGDAAEDRTAEDGTAEMMELVEMLSKGPAELLSLVQRASGGWRLILLVDGDIL